MCKGHTKKGARAMPDTETVILSRPVREESERGVKGCCGKTSGSQVVVAYMGESGSAIAPAHATSNVSADKFVNGLSNGTASKPWYRDVLIVVAEFVDDESGVVHIIMCCCHPKPVPAQNYKHGIPLARDLGGCMRYLLGSTKKNNPRHWSVSECHCCMLAQLTEGKGSVGNNQQWRNMVVKRHSSACWNIGKIDDQS